MASIDSSAPETTSSDNSPTLERRQPYHRQGPGSDSGSSGKSSSDSSSSGGGVVGDKLSAVGKLRAGVGGVDDDDNAARYNVPLMPLSRSSTPGMKVIR